jgi:hypothetical protein
LMKYVKISFSASLAVNEIATGEYLSVDTVWLLATGDVFCPKIKVLNNNSNKEYDFFIY